MKVLQNERKVLVSALLKAEKSGYSNIVLNSVLGETDLDSVKKGFVTTAFYGVLERKLFLDFVLNKFLKKPIEKSPPVTASVLRAGAYQILFMDKVPSSAAVNESVKLIRKSKESGKSGLVNAVLRKVSSENLDSLLNEASENVRFSVSKWIYDKLILYYGKEQTHSFLENSLLPPPLFVKANTIKTTPNALEEKLTLKNITLAKTDLEGLFKAESVKNIEKSEEYLSGEFFVQDFSSSVAAAAVMAKPGMKVLDACAAPGGKTFSIAAMMENRGEITALDLHEHRVKLIENGAIRLGADIVRAKTCDAASASFSGEYFDRVLCDVPCSGIGVIRRKPEIKYKDENECSDLPQIQLEILENSAKYLKKGGRLIYSTCTLLKNENEEVVNRFLERNKDFAPAKIGVLGIEDTNVTFIPPNFLGDGFFVAAFERK